MNANEKVYQCMRKDDIPCSDRRATDMTNAELHELIKQAQRDGIATNPRWLLK